MGWDWQSAKAAFIELLGEDTEQLKAWLEPILNAVDADVLVTDDADAFKKSAMRQDAHTKSA